MKQNFESTASYYVKKYHHSNFYELPTNVQNELTVSWLEGLQWNSDTLTDYISSITLLKLVKGVLLNNINTLKESSNINDDLSDQKTLNYIVRDYDQVYANLTQEGPPEMGDYAYDISHA